MRLLVGAMMVTLALAGCTDDGAYVPDEGEACVVTAADDFDSCAAEEQGLGRNEVAHRHDYWQGQDRIQVMDVELATDRIGAGSISWCDSAWPWYELVPDDGFTIIQGTSEVHITMDWDDEPYDLYRDPELWVKTAAMSEPEFVATISSGETVVFESTNADNDLPHSLISAWQFIWAIYPEDPNDPACNLNHWSGFRATVEIVKGLEIPLFPGHPDQWDGGNITDMEVLREDATINYHRGDRNMGGTCLGGTRCLWDPWLLNAGAIVPYDSQRMVVELSYTPETDEMYLDFAYHGADTRELTYLDPDETTDGDTVTQVYEIDLARIQNDGPYNLQSLWELWVYPRDNVDPTTDDGTYAGDITLVATVYKDPA